jgi:hypothetical protein
MTSLRYGHSLQFGVSLTPVTIRRTPSWRWLSGANGSGTTW